MPKASPLRSSFNAGELSPLMDGRVDVAKYANGCRILENMIPAVQGPAVRRGGTRFVAEVKASSARTWLATFEFSNDQAFVLEFGNFYVRFFTNGGRLESPPGTPYEVATPYTTADLTDADGVCRLSMVQSGDVVYIAHPSYPLHKLSRLSNTNWTMAPVTLKGGPFKAQNTDKSKNLYVSAITGTITLTADFDVFDASSVGAIVYLEPADLRAIKPWTPAQEFTNTSPPLNVRRRSDGKNYICTTPGAPAAGRVWRTGPNKPTHTYGIEEDGDGSAVAGTTVDRSGLAWQFQNAGYGYVRITAVGGLRVATADVISDWDLPEQLIGAGGATFRWAFSAFNPRDGWPSKVTFFRERLCLAKDQTLYFSAAGDFENFSALDDGGQVTAAQAIQATVSSDQVNQTTWLAPAQALLIGTAGAEFGCAENATSEPFAPGNVKIEQQGSEGSRQVAPLRVGSSTLAVQRSGRKLMELSYNIQLSSYEATDLTVLAEHITRGGIVQMAWHREPYRVAWCVRGDGQLLGFTFNREQDVLGWHRHILGGAGIVESVAVIPAPTRDRDQLWLIVRRTINGVTRRYVEVLEREYQAGDTQASAYYVDCGLSYSGAPVTTISGLGHLEGETVQVLADGAAHPDRTVAGGSITLQRPASVVHVGLGYVSTVQTNRIEAGAGDGTAQGKTKRIHKVVLRFFQTLGAKAGPSPGRLDTVEFRSGADPMDAPPPLFTGDKLLEWPGDYDFDGLVTVQQAQPLPMTLVAIMPQLHTQDR